MNLSSPQIRQLKKLAHHLKPVVLLGQQGLSDNVINEIDLSLDAHELIKVKLAGRRKRPAAKSAKKSVGVCMHI